MALREALLERRSADEDIEYSPISGNTEDSLHITDEVSECEVESCLISALNKTPGVD